MIHDENDISPEDREAEQAAADAAADFDDDIEEDEDDFDSESEESGEELNEDNVEDINPLENLLTEHATMKDQVLRMAAEMENLRKRTTREVQEARQYAISGFARDMLSATDNLARALQMLPPEMREEAEGPLKSLFEGIDMTEHEMQRMMEKNGVKKVEPLNERFDPNFHQAMYEVPDESVPAGLCVQVVQVGYVIGDRMLRPAMVGVSKGGPKHGAAPETKLDKSV